MRRFFVLIVALAGIAGCDEMKTWASEDAAREALGVGLKQPGEASAVQLGQPPMTFRGDRNTPCNVSAIYVGHDAAVEYQGQPDTMVTSNVVVVFDGDDAEIADCIDTAFKRLQ